MQPPAELPHLRWEPGAGLEFPTLLDEQNLDAWLEHSGTSEHAASPSMASQKDDSSVDGTVSSVGESTWDMIDEGSVASEDAASAPPRMFSSMSDVIESVHVAEQAAARGSDCCSATTEDSEAEDARSDGLQNDPPASPAATPVTLHPLQTDVSIHGTDAAHAQDWHGTIRVDEISHGPPSSTIKQGSAQVCVFGPATARQKLSRRQNEKSVVPLTGHIHLSLRDGGLEVKDTFKLLYYGPREMKSAITQKIGSALAANPRRPLLNDGPGSSRVTVVPISSFVDESSPEVVMIESGGFDMIIEECIAANLNERDGITLDTESGNTIEHWIDQSTGVPTMKIDAPTGVPDLGIIYLPEKSVSPERLAEQTDSQNAILTQLLFKKLGIPCYVITDMDWLDERQVGMLGFYDHVPHRSIEALVEGTKKTWVKLPIDITTFLALDASQLHQNLVALKSVPFDSHPSSSQPTGLEKRVTEHIKSLYEYGTNLFVAARCVTPKTWLSVTAIMVTLISVFLVMPYWGSQNELHLESAAADTYITHLAQSFTPRSRITKSQPHVPIVPTPAGLANLIAAETKGFAPFSQSQARKKESRGQRRGEVASASRDPVIRVFGDSHILIRSFKPSVSSNSLRFETKRNNKFLRHTLQKIDEEYLVLEIYSADAYGQIEVRIWTTGRPRYNETFEIDLGFPWFKLKGWREIAEGAAKTTVTEAKVLQAGLLRGLQEGAVALGDLRKSEAVITTLAKISASMKDLEEAVHLGSTKILHRHIRETLRAQRKLSTLLRKAHRTSTRQSSKVLAQQARLSAEIKELIHIMSERLVEQRSRLEKALHSLKAAPNLSRAHEKQLRKLQKKLLHAWWKVRGRPN